MDNHLDKKIKQEFDNRTITPSFGNWDLIDKELDAIEKVEKKRSYLFYGLIAASILGAILVYFSILTPKKEVILADQKPKENQIEKINIIPQLKNKPLIADLNKDNNLPVILTDSKPQAKLFSKKNNPIRTPKTVIPSSKIAIQNKPIQKEQIIKLQPILLNKQEENEELSINSSDDILDEEVDQLLAKAMAKINFEEAVAQLEDKLATLQMEKLLLKKQNKSDFDRSIEDQMMERINPLVDNFMLKVAKYIDDPDLGNNFEDAQELLAQVESHLDRTMYERIYFNIQHRLENFIKS